MNQIMYITIYCTKQHYKRYLRRESVLRAWLNHAWFHQALRTYDIYPFDFILTDTVIIHVFVI